MSSKMKLRTITFDIQDDTIELYHEVFKEIFDNVFAVKVYNYSLRSHGAMIQKATLKVLLRDEQFNLLRQSLTETIELKNVKYETEGFENE